MRFATFLPPTIDVDVDRASSYDLAPHGRAAVVAEAFGDDLLIDLELGARAIGRSAPSDMLGIIEGGDEVLDIARELVRRAPTGRLGDQPVGDGEVSVAFDLVELLAPLPRPASLRDFYAYEKHVRRGFAKRGEDIPQPWFELPAYYKGNHRSILGPETTIPWPRFTEELDYELELAMIVGRRGRDLTADEAADHIFGYTLMNDMSARDLQRKEMQVRLGPSKSKDFATVLGPVIVSADELDVSDIRVVARIDGEVVTDSRTDDMRWSFAQMLAYVSQGEDVFPGDVYGSGTVSNGCGLEHGRMLQPGETIELEAEGIGVLRNRIGERPA